VLYYNSSALFCQKLVLNYEKTKNKKDILEENIFLYA